MSSTVDNIDKVHEQLIAEEGINMSDLPIEIQRKIKGWNLLFARLQKNPEDSKLFTTLQKQSVEIADKIQDFIENDFDEEDEEEGKGEGAEGQEPEKTPKADNPKDDSNEGKPTNTEPKPKQVNKSPEAQNKRFGNLVMEKKILAVMNGSDRISVSKLEEIIGKEADYPEQEVHNLRLRKVFLASQYRIV